jgi:serine/threonine protein kinase
MSIFTPHVGMMLSIESTAYEFLPHPLFPDDESEVFVTEGGEALVYQLRDCSNARLYALKVMKPAYRSEQCARVANALIVHKDAPGMFLGHRLCLTKENSSDVIALYPDLLYATLMPWLTSQTWAGLLQDATASAAYTPAKAHRIATATANVLAYLEAHNLAHTDIAGGNILLAPDYQWVELLDIEGIYLPNMPTPTWRSQGSPGYQHRTLDERGQWRLDGDRFAGAILLTEMLTWWNPLVRAHTADDAETLFAADELQKSDFPRWHAVRNTLWRMNPMLLSLFDQAWTSSDLAQCPKLSSWATQLLPYRK